MCTYVTVGCLVSGSVKAPGGVWQQATEATVYFDHPVHTMAEHTLNIDVATAGTGPSGRVALELTAGSARALVAAIQSALASAGEDRTG